MNLKVHPVTACYPMMSDIEMQELCDDIKIKGLQQPVVVQGDVLLDGRNRMTACQRVGVAIRTAEYEGDDPAGFIISTNKRRNLTDDQRTMVAARIANLPKHSNQFFKDTPNGGTISQAAAAASQDVSVRQVQRAKAILDASPEIAERVAQGELKVSDAEKLVKPHVAQNSGDNEWYTPKPYIEAARAVMGTIEIDPASSLEANKVVKAERIYTAEDNGLKHDWTGKTLWMNCPYSSDLIPKFVEKLASSVESGNVKEALVLVNNATETKWFARLASVSTFLCFPTGRVKFWHPRKESVPLQGQTVAYIGKHGKSFVSEFKQFGIVVEIIR